MADRYARFTKRARRVLTLAQEEAQRLNHNYIGTEHLLLGLVREENGVAVRVLQELNVDLKQVRERVERTVGRGQRAMYGKLSLTPRTKRVIELAVDETRRLGHHYIGTEHLLLGLVREGEGVAVDVLKGLGVSLDKVRAQTARVMMENSSRISTGSEFRRERLLVDQLGIDLTVLAEEGKLDPAICREVEIERVIQILLRRKQNNPLIVGHPGVGKTAIVHQLAQRIVTGKAPEMLRGKRITEIDLDTLVSRTMQREQLAERIRRTVLETQSAAIILFIDNIQEHMARQSEAFRILQSPIIRGDLQLICITTVKGYEAYFKSNLLLARAFVPVFIEEPAIEETIQMLQGIRSRYEAHHNVEITDEALEAAARLADRYLRDQYQPDKSIQIMDEACSRVRLYKMPFIEGLDDQIVELREIRLKLQEAISARRFELAADLRDREQALQDQIDVGQSDRISTAKPRVTAEDILEAISMSTGISKERLTDEETSCL